MTRPLHMLDTNTCIYIINRRPPQVLERFEGLRPGQVAMSCITGAELSFGVEKSGSARNRRALDKFFAPLEVLPFDEAAMRQYGVLRAHLEAAGTPIGSLDTLIAAHAVSVGAICVTSNEREFSRVPGLVIENWT